MWNSVAFGHKVSFSFSSHPVSGGCGGFLMSGSAIFPDDRHTPRGREEKGEERVAGSSPSSGKAWTWLAHVASARPGPWLPPHKDAGKPDSLVPRENKWGAGKPFCSELGRGGDLVARGSLCWAPWESNQCSRILQPGTVCQISSLWSSRLSTGPEPLATHHS